MTASTAPVVLIVEDEPDVADTYYFWLRDDYEVRTAADGDEALDELDATVDVVLLDRMMPGLSGDEVLERIQEQGLDCQVSMVTAVEPGFDIIEMGFDTYLCKPVRRDELCNTVAKLLERSTYDDLLQEYYALVEKQATLETTKTSAELGESDEYDDLRHRIDDLESDLSQSSGGIDDDADFITAIQNISGDDT